MKLVLSRRTASFTLIELLAVIAIIAILSALVLFAFSGVFRNAARSRARTEIATISTAMESYKADNGAYPTPTAASFTSTNDYTNVVTTPQGLYQQSSAFLYQSLTGQTNYGDAPPLPASGTKIYMVFKTSQLGNDKAGAGEPIYIQDPFGNSYGYFPGYVTSTATNAPYNGVGLFDLWSTGGDDADTNAPAWITDWSN